MSRRVRAAARRARDAPGKGPVRLTLPPSYTRASLEMAGSDVITGAINRISRAFAMMPVRLYRGFEPMDSDQRAQMMGVRANPRMSAYAFKLAMETNRNTVGRAYAVKLYDELGQLCGVQAIAPERVTPVIDEESGELYYAIRRDDAQMECLHRYYVMQLLFGSSDGIHAISPADLLRGTIGYDQDVKTYSLDNLRSINKAIVLEYPSHLSGEAREQSVQETYKLYRESGGKVLALDPGVKLSNVTGTPFDGGALNVDAITRSRVEMVYGLPPGMLGGSGSARAATAEENNLQFLTDTMLPRVAEWEQELDAWLLTEAERRSGWHFAIDATAYLAANAQARANLVQTRIRNGQMTPNEGRAQLGLAPKAGGDVLLVSKDLAPVDLVARGATIDINAINGEHNSGNSGKEQNAE